jgi:RNA polymerase sigma factor (sigma-70 family)
MRLKTDILDNKATVEIFFEDVSQIPTILGKAQYRPLTRRVERGRLLIKLSRSSIDDTIRLIQKRLTRNIIRLKKVVGEETTRKFLVRAIQDADKFIDHYEWPFPPSLKFLKQHTVSKEIRDSLWRSSWECVYLLSLIPPDLRNRRYDAIDTGILLPYFRHIMQEYTESKKRLVEGTLRYSIRLARHYLSSGVSYLDLVQEGVIGQLRAIDMFQEAAGAHFQSYSAHWIKQRMHRYIANYSRLIRVPVHQHEKSRLIKRAITEVQNECIDDFSQDDVFIKLGWLTITDIQHVKNYHHQVKRQASYSKLVEFEYLLTYKDKDINTVPDHIKPKILNMIEASKELTYKKGHFTEIELFHYLGWLTVLDVYHLNGVTPKITDEMLKSLRKLNTARKNISYYDITSNANHYSLTQQVHGPDESYETIEDYLMAPETIEDQAITPDLYHGLNKFLDRLDERERDILCWRYGMKNGEEHTLDEIGKMYGVTRERIRQIEARALSKLRTYHTYDEQSNLDDLYNWDDLENLKIQSERELLKLIAVNEADELSKRKEVLQEEKKYITSLIDKHIITARRNGRKILDK